MARSSKDNMKKLNILGAKVSIKMIAPKNKDNVAEYDPVTKCIFLDPNSETVFRDYAHEIFHAIWDRAGMAQTSISGDIEEILCENFSNFLEQNIVTLYQTFNKLNKMKPKK
jgi:hypothetical protein